MRTIKFRFYKNNKLVGEQELKPNGIIDMAYEWDHACQFTGLLDRLGKEIYEGDILTDHNRKYICSWKKEEAAFVIYGEDKYKNTTIGHRAGSAKWVQRHFEVIGNIYENPELLEDEEVGEDVG